MKEIRVKTYESYKASEKPLSITLGEDEIKITEIIYKSVEEDSQTRERIEKYIVRGDDLKIYHISYARAEDKWSLGKVEE